MWLALVVKDGLALIRQLRAPSAGTRRDRPRGRRLGLCVVSDGRAAAAAGYQAHVAKPFEPAAIVQLVAVLGRSQPPVRGAARDS